jgi:hypothetical protein
MLLSTLNGGNPALFRWPLNWMESASPVRYEVAANKNRSAISYPAKIQPHPLRLNAIMLFVEAIMYFPLRWRLYRIPPSPSPTGMLKRFALPFLSSCASPVT